MKLYKLDLQKIKKNILDPGYHRQFMVGNETCDKIFWISKAWQQVYKETLCGEIKNNLSVFNEWFNTMNEKQSLKVYISFKDFNYFHKVKKVAISQFELVTGLKFKNQKK